MNESAPSSGPRRSVIAYGAITYLVSWSWLAFLLSRGGYAALGWVGPFVFMWAPGVCSLLCRLLFGEGFRDIGWGWRNWKATLAAIWGPLIVGVPVYGVLWLTGLAPRTAHWPLYIYGAILAVTVPILTPFSLGEELAWRGYLLDRLVKTGWMRPVFILGLIWAGWHLPLLVTGQYCTSSYPAVTVVLFVLMVLGFNAAICRLRLRSGSIWVPVLMHSVHNAVFQNVLQPVTTDNQWHTLLGGECGVLTALAYGLLAWLMWRQPKSTADTTSRNQPFGVA
ncbi:MAG: CPBP family intramembrane metalloprotease [Armatimonadota bacterium]|nr:MAG: CPBP family intramembrane metalloprotease [Armatimonadota bacterium]